MRNDKSKAIHLRKQGKSYREIVQLLHVSKGTISSWFQNEPWSQKVKTVLSQKAREGARKRMTIIAHKARRERVILYAHHRSVARKTFTKWKKTPLFVAGVIAYWGEGDKSLVNNIIRVTNVDSEMLQLFHQFIAEYLPAVQHKVHAYLILYPDLNDSVCKTHWSKKIGVPIDHFYKSHYIQGRHRTRRLPYGVCTIMIASRAHKEQMLEWVRLMQKEIRAGIV